MEFKSAVDTCLKLSPAGDCSDGPHGSIGGWAVSNVVDVSAIFRGAVLFNGEISKWGVSSVTGMSVIFAYVN